MDKSLLISVIIPCYNGRAFIGEAIESVLAQTHTDWELIVIDDASTDDSKDIVKKFCADKRIRLLENKKNLGIAKTKNKGIKISKGEILAFLDQDDIWQSDKLSLQLARLEQDAAAGVVCCAMTFTDPSGNETTVFKGFDDKDQRELIKELYITPVNSSSVMMIRRTSLGRTGVFNESLRGWDDYELLMRLGAEFRICYERRPLVKKRIHRGGAQRLPEVLAEEDRVFEGLLKVHPFLSEFKCERDARRFFDRSIELALSKEKGAHGFAGSSLALRPLSITGWALYLITMLPASFAAATVRTILSLAGKAKLVSNTRR